MMKIQSQVFFFIIIEYNEPATLKKMKLETFKIK